MTGAKHIPVGLRDNKLIGIHELTEDEYSVNCNCICPDCRQPLIACSLTGRRLRHFRHKPGEQHCHFKLDKYLSDFIMESLGKINDLPELSPEDFQRLNVSSKVKRLVPSSGDDSNHLKKKSFKVLETKGQKIRVEIEDQEFWFRLVFKKRDHEKADDLIITINLSDLVSNGTISSENLEKVKEIALYRINHSTRRREFEQINIDEIEVKSEVINPKSTDQKDTTIYQQYSPNQSNYTKYKVYNGKCPYCYNGNLLVKTNSQNGTKFFGCSNFPKCHFTLDRYYDYTLKRNFNPNFTK